MGTRKKSCEVPVQDFARIQLMFLPNASSAGKLFTDYTFPPDISSLTYVYSGDDKYEKMVFKRPKDFCAYCVFTGVGGAYDAPFPWRQWKKGAWFEAAIAVMSLNVKHMDKLIPGYRTFDQSFQNDYIGCFCFKLWRFGDWIDIVVDDSLPTMDNRLLYCQAYGTPREFWGPLAEKAYAKCKKTYEAIECGRTLDALTDLTGGVCEFYTPDVNPPENLFHLLYKSCVNRSQLVCWRGDKMLTPTGFYHDRETQEMVEIDDDSQKFLHIITAATKFPLSDGRMIEMVRLYCPYPEEPSWTGKFADKDDKSWGTVNMDFYARYKPLQNKDSSEYWMTFEDFRCNFGGLIICSNDVPYTTEGLNLERCYRRLSEDEIKSGMKSLFSAPKERRRSSDMKYTQTSRYASFSLPRYSQPCIDGRNGSLPETNEDDVGILVRENTRTVKVDNTAFNRASRMKKGKHKCDHLKLDCSAKNSDLSKKENRDRGHRLVDKSPMSCFKRLQMYHDGVPYNEIFKNPATSVHVNGNKTESTEVPACIKTKSNMKTSTDYQQFRSDSVISTCSAISECQSTFSASDITFSMQAGVSRENSIQRPKSAPSNITRNVSSGSLPNMIINNFKASSSDNFRSHGSWRYIIDYKGTWDKCDTMVSRIEEMKFHSRNPRILLNIIHPDAVNQIVPPVYHGKSHVIISLLQDYRHGASTANSLLMPIGFTVYKTKNPGKDEKRALTKLSVVGEVTSYDNSREVNIRFDLSPGSYFIVPFCLSENHAGQYIVRVLAERDPVAGKTGCVLS